MDRSKLIPVVKPEGWLAQHPEASVVHVPLRDGLVVTLAEDLGDQVRYLQQKDLPSVDIPLAELFSLAIKNLRHIAPIRGEDLGGIHMVTSGGDYEASLILDQQLISDFESRLGGTVVFAIPYPDAFLIGRNNETSFGMMANAIAGSLKGQNNLSPNIYSYSGDQLVSVAKVSVIDGQIHLAFTSPE